MCLISYGKKLWYSHKLKCKTQGAQFGASIYYIYYIKKAAAATYFSNRIKEKQGKILPADMAKKQHFPSHYTKAQQKL